MSLSLVNSPWVWDLRFQPSSHKIGFPGNYPPSLASSKSHHLSLNSGVVERGLLQITKDPLGLIPLTFRKLHREGSAAGGSGALTRDLAQGMYLGLCPTHHPWSLRPHLPQMLRSLAQLADPETQVEQYRDPPGSPSPRVHIKPKEDGMSDRKSVV